MEVETVIKEIEEMIEITEEKILVSKDDVHKHYLRGYVDSLRLEIYINFNSNNIKLNLDDIDLVKLENSYHEGFYDAELVLDYYREVCKEWN